MERHGLCMPQFFEKPAFSPCCAQDQRNKRARWERVTIQGESVQHHSVYVWRALTTRRVRGAQGAGVGKLLRFSPLFSGSNLLCELRRQNARALRPKWG
eukprot:1103100-Amphidinium_carterae.3